MSSWEYIWPDFKFRGEGGTGCSPHAGGADTRGDAYRSQNTSEAFFCVAVRVPGPGHEAAGPRSQPKESFPVSVC
jgi:hypothetical protein